MKRKILSVIVFLCLFQAISAQGDGYLLKNGKRVFVFGSYYLSDSDAALKEMVNAGLNLFPAGPGQISTGCKNSVCRGWVPLPLAEGVSDNLKKLAGSVAGHPALALWEGPDEFVWWFTAHSNLYKTKKIHHAPGAWRNLAPEALKYAKEQSRILMPKVRSAIAYVQKHRPIILQMWINEAENSDMGYVQEYMDDVDTGCDIAIQVSAHQWQRKGRQSMQPIGKSAKRWTAISENKPIYMVLQGFSWNELVVIDKDKFKDRPVAYPSFEESRYMAYDVIANGTRGILYWDMKYLTSNEYRTSLFGLANEFNALQPFLTTDPKPITISTYQPEEDTNNRVVGTARQYGRDWISGTVE